MKDVSALSNNRVTLSTGTLYGALKRLLESKWIKRARDPEANQSGSSRKAYSLTKLGRCILDAEIERLQTLVTTACLRTGESKA